MSATASVRRRHEDWLNLLQRSGPFLSVPVLTRTWPAGLEPLPRELLDSLRPAFQEWLEDPIARHRDWITFVLTQVLSWGGRMAQGPDVPQGLETEVPEHKTILRPDFAFRGDDGACQVLGTIWAPGTALIARIPGELWTASPVDRLAVLLRQNSAPLGLTTDGRWWALVWAPAGGATAVAVWDGAIWLEERDTLAAFRCLLELRRFVGVPDAETLPALLAAGLGAQEEITESLGRQVRQAVEMLVEAIGRAGRIGGPAESLVSAIEPEEIYHGAVTVMMRLIFLLFAEERLLLPADDDLYLNSYSAGQLAGSLREIANKEGEETLEHRTSAWHRLLSLFRAVHRGLAHDRIRIPAYGGGVFDPDGHPWLEGRHSADDAVAAVRVLPVDDRTILHALEAIQFVTVRGERRRLTFRTLDVEQIGYVYEGLLGYDARRASEPVVGLTGRAGEEPEVPAAGLAELAGSTTELQELTGWTARRVEQTFAPMTELEHRDFERLLRGASGGDEPLIELLLPFARLLRNDLRGLPVVVPTGGLYVTASPRRRLSGTHYTPRSLAEQVVTGALEPLVYSPGPLETADRSAWKLRPSREILALKVVDIAMGSGAFLVAACRYLAARVVEAWADEGNPRATRPVAQDPSAESDPDSDPVMIDARRLVIEHSLYGGDINEMAVEMAKLSLWLVSLSRERPFSFLDDRLVCGDSLLGLTSLDQIRTLHLDPKRAKRTGDGGFDLWGSVGRTLREVESIRRELAAHPLSSVRDAAYKARLLARANETARPLGIIANAMIGAVFGAEGSTDDALLKAAAEAARALRAEGPEREELLRDLAAKAQRRLDSDRPEGAFKRNPTHWPLVFPEVFETGGFDAVVGNPPFLGGQKLTGAFGTPYREYLVEQIGRGKRGSADLLAYFALVAHAILNEHGQSGLIGTNTLAQGDTREVGLDQLLGDGVIIRAAVKSAKWPTRAVNLEYSVLWSSRQEPSASAVRTLDGHSVRTINASLDAEGRVAGDPSRLALNASHCFVGSYVLGMGFTMSPEQAASLIQRDIRNRDVLFPYLNGEDLNRRPDGSPSRWVINFRDWPLERAETYPDCMEIVRRLVKPERAGNNRKNYRDYWWRFAERRPGLVAATSGMTRMLAITRVSKTVLPAFIDADVVASVEVNVFVYDDPDHLAVLSSAFHYWWVITRASTLRTDVRYTPSDVFETFPQPFVTPRLQAAGEELDGFRRPLMLERRQGLTALYNDVHNPAITDKDIQSLRAIHVEVDLAAAEAYGWSDLALEHEIHDTRQGVRFTVSPAARTELLDRLLDLNHERHAEEVAAGLVASEAGKQAHLELVES